MNETADEPTDALSIVPADGAAGYEITDRIEEVKLPFRLDGDDDRPVRVDAGNAFPTPVDGCWEAKTRHVTPLCTADVYVRTPDNSLVETLTANGSVAVPAGKHVLELSTAPVKAYLSIEGPASVDYDGRYPTVSLDDGPAAVRIGARSRHETPAGTITVTEEPADVAAALSTFGSALATTSPERSFPTLRGHPPLIETGDSLDVPSLVERAGTGVTLGVPFEYGPLFSAAPVAYYLAASIVESDDPYLSAGGTTRRLPADREGLAHELGAILRHCFTLDCATRACEAGLYDVDLQVHRALSESLDPPWRTWYDASLADRTAAYLDVPTSATEGAIDWPQTTDVKPVAENAAILPFLASDLSTIRSPPPAPTVPGGNGSGPLDEFVRSDEEPAFTRSAGDRSESRPWLRGPTQNVTDEGNAVVSPRPADSTSLAWVGPGYPMRASKPTVESYRSRLDRTLSADLTIDVTVVCNDDRMAEEADEVYGFRDHVAFDVRQDSELTVGELADLLAEDHDFFHYVGHVDERGVKCPDGFLDLEALEETGVDAFLLNACTSYRQGMALVEAGALGGVVSLTELPNSLATRVGRDLARLLDVGFPLDAALDVVGRGPFAGSAYTIVGDPRVQLCQCATGAAMLIELEDDPDGDRVLATPRCYPTSSFDLGTMSMGHFGDDEERFIGSGRGEPVPIPVPELDGAFTMARSPIEVATEIRWSDEVTGRRLAELTDQQ
ncbi:hypothetical protein [Halorarum halobium]|uniref:hypothetical protein n=1 Tax=Halorarum halobium TaxID=3075121 RepID=UPI0028AB492D|nr:hypothetical protein [Halobaculum sp. XH14]